MNYLFTRGNPSFHYSRSKCFKKKKKEMKIAQEEYNYVCKKPRYLRNKILIRLINNCSLRFEKFVILEMIYFVKVENTKYAISITICILSFITSTMHHYSGRMNI